MAPGVAAGPRPSPFPQYHRRRAWIIVVIVVGVGAVSALVLFLAAVPIVTVNNINFISVDNACGANGSDLSGGFTIRAPSTATVSVTVDNTDNVSSCTIHTLRAVTAGFTITNADVPLTVGPGGSEYLNFTVQGPASGYTGNLTIDAE
jgi:FtsP/CotA-like multicopper oxidase with cupredoxin domain